MTKSKGLRFREPPVQRGQRYGRLVAIQAAGVDEHGIRLWMFACDCGVTKKIREYAVRKHSEPSCGCLAVERSRASSRKRLTTHGESRKGANTKEYRAWRSIIGRCIYPSRPEYARYGGAGILVCDEWLSSYETFLAHMGRAPSGSHSVDRIDGTKGYEPGNVRWATAMEQSRNRRTVLPVLINGRRMARSEACEYLCLSYSSVRNLVEYQGVPLVLALYGGAGHTGRRSTRKVTPDETAAIAARRNESVRDVAAAFGISVTRVRQIQGPRPAVEAESPEAPWRYRPRNRTRTPSGR